MNQNNHPLCHLAGLVLCGGQSSRMGTDKGLLVKDGIPWVKEASTKLEALQIPVWISIHSSQQQVYSSLVSEDILLVDSVPLQGPLTGLLTAHLMFPDTDWLVLACDLADMSMIVLTQLVQSYQMLKRYECFVFKRKDNWEPLCAVYTARALQKIAAMSKQDRLPKQSMKYLIENSETHFLTLSENMQSAFKNYNLPNDLI